MYEKAKGKVKKFVAHFPSRSSIPPTGQSILTGQPTTHLHRSSSTNTLDQAGVASPTGLLPPKSVVASPPSTAAQADASASETRSPQESKSKIAKDLFKTTLVLLNTTLAGVPLPCKGVFTAVIEIINIVEKTAANEDELKKLDKRCNLIRELIEDALKGKDESRVPVELKDSILQLQNGLDKVCEHLRKYERNSLSSRLVAVISNESDSKMIEGINKSITRLLALFQMKNGITRTIILGDVLSATEKHGINQRIQSLPHAEDAAYNSYVSGNKKRQECFQGTRETILGEIEGWIVRLDSRPIYVLHGIAGIGKSTVAQTIAQRAANLGLLGASFFFSRNEERRSNGKLFFSTIARQLSQYDPQFAGSIGAALERNPDTPTRAIRDQLNELIVNPLRDLCRLRGHSVLIVIDAMDECDVQDAKEILSVFKHKVPEFITLKVFITTRPEQHIRHILKENVEQFYLHEIELSVVEADIRHYLRHRLSAETVRNELPELKPPPWEPRLEHLDALVRVAGKLFIIASTAVRFILDTTEQNPRLQMARLLDGFEEDYTNQRPEQALDDIYLQILRSAIPEGSGKRIVESFQMAVGTIILLRDSLPRQALANLITVDIDDITRALSHLHSIIPPSSRDDSLQIHHKSFRDFITDAERCRDKQFLITPKVHHSRIADHCFQIMGRHLRENICDLGFPERYLDNSKVRHLTDGRVSKELIYACIYWAEHLSEAEPEDDELLQQVQKFAFNHILNWLEVLSLIKRLDVAHPALEHAKHFACCISTTASKKLRTILDDSSRFVARFFDIIDRSALHTYHSALTLTPHDTELFHTYSKNTKNVLFLVSGMRKNWDPLIAILGGHSSFVSHVVFSPDGLRIASVSDDYTVRLWDGATGASVACLRGHSRHVSVVGFSPDGSKIASASFDNTVRLWDSVTGASIGRLVVEGHPDYVQYMAFSPDCSKIASSSGQTVRLWDSVTGVSIASLKGHSHHVVQLAFSPDGSKIASTSHDKIVWLWDGATGASIAHLKGHSHRVNHVAFSVDGSKITSASYNTVQVWDGATGASIASLEGHSDNVNHVAYSPDGSRIASASNDKTVRLWDGVTGASIASLEGHSDKVNHVTFSPDGTKIASASNDNTVRLWDGVTGAAIASLEGHTHRIYMVAFSPDGSKIASASCDHTVRLWDGAAGVSITGLEGHSSYIHSITFSPDGTKIASASHNNTARLWDGATGEFIASLEGHSSYIRTVVFSPDSSKIASASYDNTVQLWDGATGASIATLKGHSSYIHAIAFSPDSSKMASASHDNTVRLWDGATRATIASLKGHSDRINQVVFSPDGSKIASASHDNTVRLWDSTGAFIASLQGHSRNVSHVTFSPDGSKIASTSDDQTVCLWDGTTGAFIASLGHPGHIYAIAFSPDGSKVASASHASNAVCLYMWDSATGASITSIEGHSSYICAVAFSSDGSRIASVSDDNTVRLWDGATRELISNEDDTLQFPAPLGFPISLSIKKDPSMHITGSRLGNIDPARIVPLCWLTHDIKFTEAYARTETHAALGCEDGRVMLFDIRSVHLD